MKRVVQINSTCGYGSTGKICLEISNMLTEQNVENYIYYALGNNDYPLARKYMSDVEIKIEALKSRVFGNYGFQAKTATKRLISELDKIKPDIIHLHNLHSHNIHLGILFPYLKEKGIKIYWTFHDCWAFTAYCAYYDMVKCAQWKCECKCCPVRKKRSWFIDRSNYLYRKKKELFSGLNLTIITPSQWLADQVKESFFSEYNVEVINNGVDISVFKPYENDFRHKYNLEDKYIILGVAYKWEARKGLDIFIRLAQILDRRYQIVLVGTNEKIDKTLPENIISIHRTQSQKELAELYTAADLFVNPTREEVFGLVNIESLACGTPVVTFESGGSPECIDDTCGASIEKNNFEELLKMIIRISERNPFSSEDCIKHAKEFDAKEKYREYIKFYEV